MNAMTQPSDNATRQRQRMRQARAYSPDFGDDATMQDDMRDQVEHGRERAAEGLGNAAERLRDRSDERGGMGGMAGKAAASGMDAAAGYLESHTAGDMWDRLMDFAKKHPAITLAVALFLGYRIGRMMP
jgi:hypothetical protein